MTTEVDELAARISQQGRAAVINEGVPSDGFEDPEQKYPKEDYATEPSINKAARGSDINHLIIKNGVPNVNCSLGNQPIGVYPLVQVDESVSGHIIEINDTPGGERILIKHKGGSGVEIRADGSVMVNTLNKRVDLVGDDYNLAVENDGNISYYGNLNMTVQGDYNLDVKGDYNVTVGGNKILNVAKSYRQKINSVYDLIVNGSYTSKITKYSTMTFLEGISNFIKGDYGNFVDGNADYSSSKQTIVTAEEDINLSSKDMNLVAENLSVAGDEGTIGGENMVMFTKNLYAGRTVHASEVQASKTMLSKVFHGDLSGTAKGAEYAAQAGLAAAKGGSGWGGTVQNVTHSPDDPVASTTKFKPDSDIVTDYLTKESRGIKKVRIDRDDAIKNSIDESVDNAGVSKKKLTVGQNRSRLKDSNHASNNKYISNQISKGALSSSCISKIPSSAGRIRGKEQTARSGFSTIGSGTSSQNVKKFLLRESSSDGVTKTLSPIHLYNPNLKLDISLSTKLNEGVRVGKFVAARSDPITLAHTTSIEQRKQIARNLLPQADIIQLFYTLKQFDNYNIIVAEGLYKAEETETNDPNGPKELAKSGRFVAYEIFDSTSGKIDPGKTFEFAVYLKDNANYESIDLYYDNYDPEGSFNAQIGVTMPTIPTSFTANFKKSVGTFYNGTLQTSLDLVEILK